MKNKVVLSGGCTYVFMYSSGSICNMVILSGSMLDGTINGHEKVLRSPEVLAIWRSLHVGEPEFVICQKHKLVSS